MTLAAGVVLYQTGRVASIWDLSYILEHAYRIALGDVPYKDFGIPHAPGTFLVQALIIKGFGISLRNHVVYAAIVSSLTVLLTYLSLCFLNENRIINLTLTLPVAISGGFGIYPYPFYDPDCTFWMLAALAALLWARTRDHPPIAMAFAGLLACIPALFKQNTGLVFLFFIHVSLLLLVFLRSESFRLRQYRWFLAGSLATGAAVLLAIHFASGLDSFIYWTFTLPSRRRTPSLQLLLNLYLGEFVFIDLLLWILAYWIVRNRQTKGYIRPILAGLLFIAPSVIVPALGARRLSIDYFFLYSLNVWQITLLVIGFISFLGLLLRPKENTFEKLLALLLCAVVNAAFLSQGVWGSTYGIAPLLSLMLCLLYGLLKVDQAALQKMFVLQGIVSALVMAMLVQSNSRLSYIDLHGAPERATLLVLAGLTTPGPWIHEMEQFLKVAQTEIPSEDPMMLVPGEDPFYFVTHRHPRFPVLTFDYTVNPYSDEELLRIAKERGVKWLIVKTHLQMSNRFGFEHFMDVFSKEFVLHRQIDGYEIFKRKDS